MNKEKQTIEEFDKLIAIEDSEPDEYTGKIAGIEEDYPYTINKLKKFILKALKSQREEIVEKIEKIRGNTIGCYD